MTLILCKSKNWAPLVCWQYCAKVKWQRSTTGFWRKPAVGCGCNRTWRSYTIHEVRGRTASYPSTTCWQLPRTPAWFWTASRSRPVRVREIRRALPCRHPSLLERATWRITARARLLIAAGPRSHPIPIMPTVPVIPTRSTWRVRPITAITCHRHSMRRTASMVPTRTALTTVRNCSISTVVSLIISLHLGSSLAFRDAIVSFLILAPLTESLVWQYWTR